MDVLELNVYYKVPFVVWLCEKLNIDSRTLVMLKIVLGVILMFGPTKNVWTLVLIYIEPSFKTFKALENYDKEQWRRMLIYWICFGILMFLDKLLHKYLTLIPLYHIFRTVLVKQLSNKDFLGAQMIYDYYAQPLLKRIENRIGKPQEVREEAKKTD